MKRAQRQINKIYKQMEELFFSPFNNSHNEVVETLYREAEDITDDFKELKDSKTFKMIEWFKLNYGSRSKYIDKKVSGVNERFISSMKEVLELMNVEIITSEKIALVKTISNPELRGNSSQPEPAPVQSTDMSMSAPPYLHKASHLNENAEFYIVLPSKKLKEETFLRQLSELHFHLFNSKETHTGDGYVPISREFLKTHFRSIYEKVKYYSADGTKYSFTDFLHTIGLIERTAYDKKAGKSRELRLTTLTKALIISSLLQDDFKHCKFDIKKNDRVFDRDTDLTKIPFFKHWGVIPDYYLLNRVLMGIRPDLNYGALKDKVSTEFNFIKNTSVEDLVFADEEMLNIVGDIMDNGSKFVRDLAYLNSTVDRVEHQTGFITYKPVYTFSTTGRLYEIYGSQGITKESKSIVYSGDTYFNYDIKSSQVVAFLTLFEDMLETLNIKFNPKDLTFIKNYAEGRITKGSVASELGITKSDWKVIFYSILFGANYKSAFSTPRQILRRYNYNKEYWNYIVNEALKPFEVWQENIMEYFYKFEFNPEQKKLAYWNLPTPIGEKFNVDDFTFNGVFFVPRNPAFINQMVNPQRRVSAMLLQGLEASFIFRLIDIIFAKIHVVSYEFDGIVCKAPIEQNEIDLAAHRAKFSCDLVTKPFLDAEDKIFMQGYDRYISRV